MSTDVQQLSHKGGSDAGPMETVKGQSTIPRLPPTFWTGDVLGGSVGWSSWGSSVAEILESVPSCFLQSDKRRRRLVSDGCSAWDQFAFLLLLVFCSTCCCCDIEISPLRDNKDIFCSLLFQRRHLGKCCWSHLTTGQRFVRRISIILAPEKNTFCSSFSLRADTIQQICSHFGFNASK